MKEGGYRGSWLMSYNLYTHEAINWGIPLIGHSLPEATLDAERGRLFCVGQYNGLLCRDTVNHRTTYAGYLPHGWFWYERASLLDETTGKFWGTIKNDEEHRFISFDPGLNRFERHELTAPENPYTHETENLRGYTDYRAVDGSFYCVSVNGVIFRFWPEIPAVEPVGVNWDKGRYMPVMTIDKTGRYLYYMPGGSYLVIVMNGAFKLRSDSDYPFGWPSLFIIHIPEEERSLD